MPDEESVEKQEIQLGEVGRTGLEYQSGRVNEEFLTELKGDKDHDIYKEMRDNDPIVGGGITAVQNLVRQVEWEVEPGGESERDVRAADFVEENMRDMEYTWQEFIVESMSMLVFGWSWFEMVFKRRNGDVFDPVHGSQFDDGRIGWQNFSIRSQDSFFEWDFDDTGRVQALIQQPEPTFERLRIPREKSLHFRTTTHKNNPEGKSVLRNAYRPWYFKKRIEEIEGIGLERDLAGIPKAIAPPRYFQESATSQEKSILNNVKEIVKNLRNDEQAGIIIPALYDEDGNQLFDVELMSTRGRRNFDTSDIIERYNRTIAMSMLADFLVIGHESVGSFALASSKTKLFSTAIGAYVDAIQNELNRRAVPTLLELNGMTDAELPKIVHSDIEAIDLEQLAQYVRSLSLAGVDMSSDDALGFLAEQVDMPQDALDMPDQDQQNDADITDSQNNEEEEEEGDDDAVEEMPE